MPSPERTIAARVRTSSCSLASSRASIPSRSSVVNSPLAASLDDGRNRRAIGCSRMSEVAVVTDSTAYLTPQLIERHRLEIVPLYVVFGGDRTVRETEITDYPAFFEELRQAASLPTTSQPSV